MTDRMTDLSGFGPRRRNRSATGEAGHAERRARADVVARKLPDAVEHRHNFPPAQVLTTDQVRQRASYSIPADEQKRRAVAALRAELSPEIASIAASHRLNLLASRALEQVARAQKAANGWAPLNAAAIAASLNKNPASGPSGISADTIRDLILALTKLGVLDEKVGFGPGVQSTFKVAGL